MSFTEIIALIDSSINNAAFSPMYCDDTHPCVWYDVKFMDNDYIRFYSIWLALDAAKADNMDNPNLSNRLYLGGEAITSGQTYKLLIKDFFEIGTT